MSEPGGGGDPQTQARAAFSNIGLRALHSNRLRVTALDQALRSASGGTMAEDARRAAMYTAHQLVGSAGTFGYDRVSRLARELELFFIDEAFADRGEVEAAYRGVALMEQDLMGREDAGDPG